MGKVIQGNFRYAGPEGAFTLGGAPPHTRKAVSIIRHDRRIKTQDVMVRILHNYIWTQEVQKDKGTFILSWPEKRVYLLSGSTFRLYELSTNDDDFASYLWFKYGLNRPENVAKHVIASLASYARIRGKLRTVRRFTFFDQGTETLYVSRYDGTLWRLDGENCDIVPNGSGGAVFLDDDRGSSPPDPIIGHHRRLIQTLVDGAQYVDNTQGGMRPIMQRLALATWMIAVAFPDLMPSKPLLLLEGAQGSGKTGAIQMIKKALHGHIGTQTLDKSDGKDFGVHILRSPICLIDNADSYLDWLQDALCTYTTGGTWKRRKLYTDDAEVEIEPQSFIAITSRNPITFKRDDVADRCIIIRLDRRESFTAQSALLDEIGRSRPVLFGEWLWILNRVVKEIRNGGLNDVTTGADRMADFAALSYLIGNVLGATPAQVGEMLEGLREERDVLVSEHDPLHDCLDKWLENLKNSGRPVTVVELFGELSMIAKQTNRKFYAASTLAQKLRGSTLKKVFDVRQAGIRGTAKVYEIRRLAKDR